MVTRTRNPCQKPEKMSVLYLEIQAAKQCVTNFNGGGVNTHILTNVVEKATEVVKTPKELVSCHKKLKHRGTRRIKEQRKKNDVLGNLQTIIAVETSR